MTTATSILASLAATPLGARAISGARLRDLRSKARPERGSDLGELLSSVLLLVRRARFLFDRGRTDEAFRLVDGGRDVLVGWQQDARLSSVLSLERLEFSLSAGRTDEWPDDGAELVRSVLGIADRLLDVDLGTGEMPGIEASSARDSLLAVLELVARAAFHRGIHFGSSASPLAARSSTERFLAPLRESQVWRAVSQPREGRDGREPGPISGRPEHVLFISLKNWTFISAIIEDLESDGVEVRRLDLAGAPMPTPSIRSLLDDRLRLLEGRPLHPVPESVRADIEWADTIFVEWGNAAATWASLRIREFAPHAKLVVRVHSYEASTVWPQFTDWGSVNLLLTVAPAIHAMLEESARIPASVERITMPNRTLLHHFVRPKLPGSERRLALVGWAGRRKDVAWALDLLDILREADPEWSILLIGPEPVPSTDPLEAEYSDAAGRRIAELGSAATITGKTSEVAEHLRDAGVIVSSSRREGTHEGFIEGVASGAFPVCRRWPEVADWGGPETLFPAEWVVDAPEEAARRILSRTAEQRAEDGRRAAARVRGERDWTITAPLYRSTILRGAVVEQSVPHGK